MTDPLFFASITPRFGLPLLFSGQSAKEFYVNEAHALTDALLHCAVEDVADAPPAAPGEGMCWLVGSSPSGAWSGQAGKLACHQLGNWLFVEPRDGIVVLNRATGQSLRFRSGWVSPAAPSNPSGGSTIDAELRHSFAELIDALSDAGIFAAP